MNKVPYVGYGAQPLRTQRPMPLDNINPAPPRLLVNASSDLFLDFFRDPFPYLSGQRSVKNRDDMAEKNDIACSRAAEIRPWPCRAGPADVGLRPLNRVC